MNRNSLKIIATATMLIDHLGLFFFANNYILRIIGRLAFPIFAFFIAEGMRYTSNRKRYILTLCIFAIISQIPYSLLLGFKLNIIFSFLISTLVIVLIESFKSAELKVPQVINFYILTIITIVLNSFKLLDYGILGILLVLIFYFVKSRKLKFILASLDLILLSVIQITSIGITIMSIIQLFSIMSIVLLIFYNNQKGKLNLKYIFYTFYPLHLIIIYLIML